MVARMLRRARLWIEGLPWVLEVAEGFARGLAIGTVLLLGWTVAGYLIKLWGWICE